MTDNRLDKWLLIPDCHVPYQDKRAYALMLRAARSAGIKNVAILGDYLDFYAVSSHSKDPRKVDLGWEVEQGCVALDGLDAQFKGEKIYISGNHEDRLARYLMDKAPELFETVKVEKLLGLKDRGWRYVPYKQHAKIGKLHLTHDVGKAGKYAHYDALSAFQGNVVIGHCLPIDYEVLTRRGFKRLSEISVGEDVLAYENGHAIYTPVLDRVEWDYDGEMAEFDNAVIRQRMTSEHHLYTKGGRYIPVREAAETVTKADLVRFTAPLSGGHTAPLSDDMLRLVVAYSADGSRQKDTNHIRFHFSKQRKIERLTGLWKAVGGTIEWRDGVGERKKSAGLDRATQDALLDLCPDKQLPAWLLKLDHRQRRVVIDELEHWDGTVLRHDGKGDVGIRQFCSFKAVEQDLVQLLLMQAGIRSRRYPGGRIAYDLQEPDKTTDGRRVLGEFLSWAPTKERVGCISTRVQNFFIRTTEGSVELTGNTHRLGYAVEGNARGKPHVGAMFGWLGDINQVDYMHNIRARRDWAHGFGVAYVEKSGLVHLTPIPIVEGTVVLEGKLIR